MLPALRLKHGAGFPILAPAGFRILATLQQAVEQFRYDLTITSGSEGTWRDPTDPHRTGEAVDVSVLPLAMMEIQTLYEYLRTHLGAAFTVLYEVPSPTLARPGVPAFATVNPKATAPHLHIQRAKGTIYPPVEVPR